MATVPQECQALADEVASLEEQYDALAREVVTLVGAPAWVALAQLGNLQRQVRAARRELTHCVETHEAAVTVSIVMIDARADPINAAHVATLWDLTGSTPLATETRTIDDGIANLNGPVPARAAITIGADVTRMSRAPWIFGGGPVMDSLMRA